MGKARKTRKFAVMHRMLQRKDVKEVTGGAKSTEKGSESSVVRRVEKVPSHMFFKHNTALGPPYRVIVGIFISCSSKLNMDILDTNFLNAIIQNKLELVAAMMDCLLAKSIPCITDCVMAELEKLGTKHRLALRIAKDPRCERLACTHKGIYADDCIVQRAQAVNFLHFEYF
jgi:U3 small nucleolar RNA-associated protein 24